MTRRIKYATLTTYKPYIAIIRKDLGIPDDVNVQVIFNNALLRFTGEAYYVKELNWGQVKVSKRLFNHFDTLRTLMHEWKHIQQYYTGRLVGRGYRTTWLGEPAVIYSAAARKTKHLYKASPWEVEAREYEKEMDRLFPFGAIKRRVFIATVNGTRFYKRVG